MPGCCLLSHGEEEDGRREERRRDHQGMKRHGQKGAREMRWAAQCRCWAQDDALGGRRDWAAGEHPARRSREGGTAVIPRNYPGNCRTKSRSRRGRNAHGNPPNRHAEGRRRAVAADGRPAVPQAAYLLHLMPSPSCLLAHPRARSQSCKHTGLCTCAWV